MVPWPLMTCGWLYGGMSTAPVAACRSSAPSLLRPHVVTRDHADLRDSYVASHEIAASRLTWTSATFASRASMDGSHFTTCAAGRDILH